MKLNGEELLSKIFAYDGCHKIYLIEDEEDAGKAVAMDYELRPIEQLEATYNNSCELRFINNWKLDKTYVYQMDLDEYYVKPVFE